MTPAGLAIGILSISTLVLLVVVLAQWRRAQTRRTGRDTRDLMRQMERLAEDIDRRMGGALVDMQSATAQADEKIQTLRELSVQASPEAPAPDDEPPGQVEPVGDEAPEPAETPAPNHAGQVSRTHQDVLALNGEGLSSAEIAERLERPVGEVDLILRLHARPPLAPSAQQVGQA